MSGAPSLVIDREERGGPTCGDAGGRTKKGEPCAAFRRLSEDTGLCMHHDPARKDECDEIQRLAAEGYRRHLTLEPLSFAPDTLEHLAQWHQWAVKAVAAGNMASRTADSVCRHLKELRPVLLNLNRERRVRALEAAWKEAKQRVGRRRRG